MEIARHPRWRRWFVRREHWRTRMELAKHCQKTSRRKDPEIRTRTFLLSRNVSQNDQTAKKNVPAETCHSCIDIVLFVSCSKIHQVWAVWEPKGKNWGVHRSADFLLRISTDKLRFVLTFREINASSIFVEAAARRRPSKRWQTAQVSTYTQSSGIMYMRNTLLTTSFLDLSV